MPEITAANIRNLDTQEGLTHAIQHWKNIALELLHFDAHCDEVLACTLATVTAAVNWAIYNSAPQMFNTEPPPMPGCFCGVHDIERTLLKGEFDDIPEPTS